MDITAKSCITSSPCQAVAKVSTSLTLISMTPSITSSLNTVPIPTPARVKPLAAKAKLAKNCCQLLLADSDQLSRLS